jgi:hypothetical protein
MVPTLKYLACIVASNVIGTMMERARVIAATLAISSIVFFRWLGA